MTNPDLEAFLESVVDSERLKRIARRHLTRKGQRIGSPTDVVASATLSLVRKYGNHVEDELGVILVSIICNRAVDYNRKAETLKRGGAVEFEEYTDRILDAVPQDHNDLHELLWRFLDALPHELKRTFELYKEGRSYQEIAIELNIEWSGVKNRIERIKRRAKKFAMVNKLEFEI